MTRLTFFLFAIVCLTTPASFGQSQWVHFGADGRLEYARTPKGSQVPDFSSAGYRGGGVALPNAIARVKVSPAGGPDDTPLIQAALDKVAKLVPGANGERGAVELTAGKFRLAGTLSMHVSGVVLRGAGSSGTHATVLEMVGAPHLAIEMKGEFHEQTFGGDSCRGHNPDHEAGHKAMDPLHGYGSTVS
ncbi:MAG: hypothetical protein WCA10_13625 [Terracidiphilus sp.]